MNKTVETETGKRLVNVREAARRLNISTQAIYIARSTGSIQSAEGDDIPGGTWFEEEELNRWAGARRENQLRALSLGWRRKGSELKGRQQVFVASAVGS